MAELLYQQESQLRWYWSLKATVRGMNKNAQWR